MQKLLIYWAFGASLALSGCAWMNDLPFVFKPDIHQGNILDQAAVDKLQPGMTTNQVRYIMGTPMLVDVFHQERWDYVHSLQLGGEDPEIQRISLFFEDKRLQRIEGDLRPRPPSEVVERETDVVVKVPDQDQKAKGIIGRALESVGVGDD